MRIVHAEELLARERVQEEGVRVVGQLDLSDVKLTHPLVLRNCYVEEEIVLRRAEVPSVDLRGSHLWGLDAAQLRSKDDVDLSGVRTTGRALSLVGARLGGSLLLNGAKLSNLNGYALDAHNLTVEQDVLGEGLNANGVLALSGAHIKSAVHLAGARLFNPSGIALGGFRMRVGQNLSLGWASTTGQVVLVGARVQGDVTAAGAQLSNSTRESLIASDLIVEGAAHFGSGFRATSVVFLTRASIGGPLDFQDARLNGLFAEHLSVGRDVNFSRASATDELNLSGAHIKGELDFSGAHLSNRGDIALDANNLAVDQNITLADTAVTGAVHMMDARIGGNLNILNSHLNTLFADDVSIGHSLYCFDSTIDGEIRLSDVRVSWLGFNGSTVTNPDSFALQAQRLHVDSDLSSAHGFTATGEIDLLDATIGGRLDFTDAVLDSVTLEGLRAAKLEFSPRRTPHGVVDLTNAEVGGFEDDPATWPNTLRLRGFRYDAISEAPVRLRVKWLRRHEGGYAPGLYDNLAAAYKRAGRVEFARRVGIAKQWHRRTEMNPLGKALNWLLYLTVGYGYRTGLAWLWLAALLAAGTVVFAGAHPAEIVPATPTVSEFQPFVYALDVLLPVVDLGQQKDWVARGAALWWSWGLIGSGWILTTAVVAGLTTALKRD